MSGILASGIVPEFKLEALPAVNPPDVPVVIWFSVATLAAATVPDEIFEPFKLVRDAPDPLNVVAVQVPVTVAPEEVVSSFFSLS